MMVPHASDLLESPNKPIMFTRCHPVFGVVGPNDLLYKCNRPSGLRIRERSGVKREDYREFGCRVVKVSGTRV